MSVEESVVAAAVRPGAVIGVPGDGLTNFISNLDDIARGEVAGYNSRVTGGYRELFPRLSRKDHQALVQTRLPEQYGVLEHLLSSIRGLPAASRDAFLAARKVVKQVGVDGTARLIVVPRVPESMDEVEILDLEDGAGYDAPDFPLVDVAEVETRRRDREYSLTMILSDFSILDAYNLPARSVETAKRIAASDPDAAARLFQTMMNASQTTTNVKVKAAAYGASKVQARNTIKQMCKGAPRTDAAVEAMVSLDKVMQFGPDGHDGWHVSGPLSEMQMINYVYWMIRENGTIFPSVLLSMELTQLGIDVFDGFSAQEPELDYHAAFDTSEMVEGLSSDAVFHMSTESRVAMAALTPRFEQIVSSDGVVCASAVRITDRYVVVNSHVIEADPGCEIKGEKIMPRAQLSRDVWSARCDGKSQPWYMRKPLEGELAVVACPSASGEMTCSAPLKVTSVDSACVVTTLDSSVVHGMSGGALVALSDMALLGIHSAATRTNLVSYRFGEKEFAEVLEADSITSTNRGSDVASYADKVAAHFKKRGLWGVFETAVESLTPLYVAGVHVGMGVSNGDHLYTTCDANQALRVGPERRVAEFESYQGNAYFRTAVIGNEKTPVYRRTPNYFEKVFVVGTDGAVYISPESRVMHVGPNARNFVIADIPQVDKSLTGGLIMGWDGAILGCCGAHSMTTSAGLGYLCYPLLAEEKPAPNDPRATLAAAFPFLNLAAWPDDIIEEVFTHSSVNSYHSGAIFNAGMKPLANIGDNIAKVFLYQSLREAGVPHPRWSECVQSMHSNVRFAELAWKYKYAQAMVVGTGVSVQKNSKPYADLTEALLGAAHLLELPDVVKQLCVALEIVYVEEKPEMVRTASNY